MFGAVRLVGQHQRDTLVRHRGVGAGERGGQLAGVTARGPRQDCARICGCGGRGRLHSGSGGATEHAAAARAPIPRSAVLW
jgi:hypothetical protein